MPESTPCSHTNLLYLWILTAHSFFFSPLYTPPLPPSPDSDCKQCLSDSRCGFCGGRLACMEGNEFGPTGEDAGPSSCPRRFMPTWAFKTPAAGTSRCPLRQLHMTEEATKEDIAVLRAKKLYHRLKQLRDALAACKLKMAGMGIKHTPERILTGQQCKDLAKEILTVQAEMASAVKAMRSASSGGSAKTYEMGYKEGLTQAQREAARQIGYIKGLKEGWEKAQRAPGPIGPAGPAGPRGPKGQVGNSGNQADASVVKKVMEEEIANEAGEKAELEGAKKERFRTVSLS